MSIRTLGFTLLVAAYTSPIALYSAAVSYLQPQLPQGSSIVGIKTDANGNLYLLSSSASGSVVTKVSAGTGQSVWTTPVPDAIALAVGPDGSVFLTGAPYQQIITSSGAMQDMAAPSHAYLLKLTASGAIAFATDICGTVSCEPKDIAVDLSGDVWVTGAVDSQSSALIPTPGTVGTVDPNVFTLKIDPSGSEVLFAVGAGGSVMTLDSQGNAYFAYEDDSAIPVVLPNPSVYHAAQHIVGIDSTGSRLLLWVFLPNGAPAGIAVDPAGSIYLAGTPYASDYPIEGSAIQATSVIASGNYDNLPIQFCKPNLFMGGQECFGPLPAPPLPGPPTPTLNLNTGYISAIDHNGVNLFYSTYFGGTGPSAVASIAVDQTTGNIDLIGYATSSDLPGLDSGSRHCAPSLYFSQISTSLDAPIQTTAILPISGLQALVSALGPDGNLYVSDGASVAVINPQLPNALVACVANSADLVQTATVAPGQLITLFGDNLANVTAAGAPSNGLWPTALPTSDVSVTFDGIAAPLLYVSPHQINVQAPFEISGKTQTNLQLARGGSPVDTRALAVVASAPTIFQVPIAVGDCPNIYPGATEILAINQDGSRNSCSHPAPLGSTVTFFVNGLGVTSLASVTGAVTPVAVAEPNQQVTIPVDGFHTFPNVTFGQVTSLANSLAGVYSVTVTSDPSYNFDVYTPLHFNGVPAVNGLDIHSCANVCH